MATCGTCSKEYKADTRYNRGGNCTNCCRKGICVNCHDPGLIASKGLCDACYKFKRRWGCDRYSTESLQRLPEKQRRLTEIEKLTQERDEAREAIRTMCSGWPALDGDKVMPKYTVIGLVAASVQVSVDANDPEDAIGKADLPSTGICYQCSRDLEVGDVYDFIVLDADGKEVLGPNTPVLPAPSSEQEGG